MCVLRDWEDYFCDGLHFNAKGNEYLFNGLKLFLEDIFPDFTQDSLMPQYPDWSEVNNDHLDQSFANISKGVSPINIGVGLAGLAVLGALVLKKSTKL